MKFLNPFYSFELVTIQDIDNIKVLIPSPIKQFLFDYKHSLFIECNSELSKINSESMKKNIKKLARVAMKLNYLTNSIESMYKSYSLSGGTVLGE